MTTIKTDHCKQSTITSITVDDYKLSTITSAKVHDYKLSTIAQALTDDCKHSTVSVFEFAQQRQTKQSTIMYTPLQLTDGCNLLSNIRVHVLTQHIRC